MKEENTTSRVKTIDDYIEELDTHTLQMGAHGNHLKRIMTYGLERLFDVVRHGADVEVCNDMYNVLFGNLQVDDFKRAGYQKAKYKTKYRLLYSYLLEDYDGYYYFGLDDEEFAKYEDQIKKHPRTKDRIFKNVRLYKIHLEAFLDKPKKHFFKTFYPTDVGW